MNKNRTHLLRGPFVYPCLDRHNHDYCRPEKIKWEIDQRLTSFPLFRMERIRMGGDWERTQ